MHEQQDAIVIKLNSLKRKIILFDKQLGKIEVFFENNIKNINLCNGTYINYNIQTKHNVLKIKDIVVLNVPLIAAKKNILFLHHILELCYYFTPWQMQLTELFDLIKFGLYFFEKLENVESQKIFLIKFFLILGLYPENEILKNYLYKILHLPNVNISNVTIGLDEEKELDLWIEKCINMHPNIKSFKTMNYLNEIIV